MPLSEESFDAHLEDMLEKMAKIDPASEDATVAVKNIVEFSKLQPPTPEPEPESILVPETKWYRVKAGLSAVWDNETTRVVIKTAGTFGGVLLVTYATINRDTVLERTALQQANQRPS